MLYQWRTDLSSVPFWAASKRPLTFGEFKQELQAMAVGNMLLMFEARATGEPVGFGQVAQIDTQHGHASILFFISRSFRKRGRYPVDAFLLLERYLFEYFPFRKLYADVLEYNRDSWSSILKLGWKLEGRLREHTWFRDRYWDSLRLSIGRTDWEARAPAWQRRLTQRPVIERQEGTI